MLYSLVLMINHQEILAEWPMIFGLKGPTNNSETCSLNKFDHDQNSLVPSNNEKTTLSTKSVILGLNCQLQRRLVPYYPTYLRGTT